jgi:hypothetical protein
MYNKEEVMVKKAEANELTFSYMALHCPQGTEIAKIKAHTYEEAIIKALEFELEDKDSDLFFKIGELLLEKDHVVDHTDIKSKKCAEAFFKKWQSELVIK